MSSSNPKPLLARGVSIQRRIENGRGTQQPDGVQLPDLKRLYLSIRDKLFPLGIEASGNMRRAAVPALVRHKRRNA